jgi:DNA helicase-2/ATP-dependent DNA helicase PcrA
MFRATLSNWQVASTMGTWAAANLKREAAVIASDYLAGHDIADAFRDSFVKGGGKVVKEIFTPPGTNDFSAYISDLVTSPPPMTYVFYSGSDAIRFVKQYDQFGLKAKSDLIGFQSTLDADTFSGQGDSALGAISSSIYCETLDTPENKAYVDLFREKKRSYPGVFDESGYTAVLQAERSVEASGRLENLSELARAMEEYETLGEFLEHVSLVMDNDRGDTGASVTIMTIHAAKGLEYDNVFLVGWEEGIFPSQRALDEGGLASLEEERRLAYVAITRAKRKCTIIHAANRRIYGQWTSSIPSRFIEELPLDHIEAEQSMTGGASLWRANWSEQSDPFAHLAAANQGRSNARGPGWQRAATSGGFNPRPQRIAENTRSAVSLGNKGRSDLSIGLRVFHEKFGYGAIALIEGNKLEIDFEQAGRKRVMDSFVSLG